MTAFMRACAICTLLLLGGCVKRFAARPYFVSISAQEHRLPSGWDVKNTLSGYPITNLGPGEWRVSVDPLGQGRYLVAIRTYRRMLPDPGQVKYALDLAAEQSEGGYVVTVK